MAHRDQDGDSAFEDMRRRMQEATKAHLGDIRREHGAGKRWTTLILPSGVSYFINTPPLHSGSGSPGALCAANGDFSCRSDSSAD